MVKSVVCTHLSARVSPEAGVTLYKSVLRPIIEFGGEAIDIKNKKKMEELESNQFELLRSILCLFPHGSSKAMSRILCGLPPIKARWDYRRLTFLRKLVTSEENSIYLANMRCDASMKSNRTWLALSLKIFSEYFEYAEDMDIFEYFQNSSQIEWNNLVSKSINEKYYELDVQGISKLESRGKLLSEILPPFESYNSFFIELISSHHFKTYPKYISWYTRILSGHFSFFPKAKDKKKKEKINLLKRFENFKNCPFCMNPIETDFRIHIFIDCLQPQIWFIRLGFVENVKKILSENELESDLEIMEGSQNREKMEIVKVLLGAITTQGDDKDRRLRKNGASEGIVKESAIFLWSVLSPGNRRKLTGNSQLATI